MDDVLIQKIIQQIESHGINVRVSLPASVHDDLGRISGSTITVVGDNEEPTIPAFTLCHLFGHLIQLTTPDQYRHLIDAVDHAPPVMLSDEFWVAFYSYEREAFAYGAVLLERAAGHDEILQKRYSIFMEMDFEHFREYMTTTKRLNRLQFRAELVRRYLEDENPLHIPLKPFAEVSWPSLKLIDAAIF